MQLGLKYIIYLVAQLSFQFTMLYFVRCTLYKCHSLNVFDFIYTDSAILVIAVVLSIITLVTLYVFYEITKYIFNFMLLHVSVLNIKMDQRV